MIVMIVRIAEIIDEKAQYTKNKAMDDQYYMDLIIKYLVQFKKASKADIVSLLNDKLSNVLDKKQKDNKVKNLLAVMHRSGVIDYKKQNQRIG